MIIAPQNKAFRLPCQRWSQESGRVRFWGNPPETPFTILAPIGAQVFIFDPETSSQAGRISSAQRGSFGHGGADRCRLMIVWVLTRSMNLYPSLQGVYYLRLTIKRWIDRQHG